MFLYSFIVGIRCAAHTVQLSIGDTLKNSWDDDTTETYLSVIALARKVVKELRTSNNMMIINRLKLTKPILDCPTR